MKEKIKQKFGKLRALIGISKNKSLDWKSGYALKIFLAAVLFLIIVLTPALQAHAGVGSFLSDQGSLIGNYWTGKASSAGAAVRGAANSALEAVSNLFGIADIAGWVVGWVAWVASAIISFVLGIVISIEGWLIGVVLQINRNVIQTSIVQSGFGVTLALANLGFVLGIIIIALATILRRETYGIKQILWKLVAAAILVNFSLVIAGPIIEFSQSITDFFMASAIPGQQNTAGGQLYSYLQFASRMATVFQPQRFMAPDAKCSQANTATEVVNECLGGLAKQAANGMGKTIGAVLAPLVSILGVVIGLIIIVVVLFVFFITLLIRYIYLSILLILMPLAWVAWVFPRFSQQWSKWWGKFFQWTFYPPIVIFFVWLVLQAGAAMDKNINPFAGGVTSGSLPGFNSTGNPFFATISQLPGAAITPIIDTLLRAILLCGLLIGGMIAAQSMSITGAGMAVSAAKGIQKGITSWTGRQGKKLGRFGLQKIGLTKRLEEGRLGATLGRIPGARRLAGIAGRQLRKAEVAGGAGLVEAESRNVPDDKEAFKSQLAGSMKKELQFAFIRKAIDKNWMKDVENIGGKTVKAFLTENQQNFKNYQQGKLRDDANVAEGGDQVVRDAEVEMDKAKTPEALEAAAKKLDKAMDKFIAKLDQPDVAKMGVDKIFSPTASKRLVEALQKSLAKTNPALVPAMLRRMKGVTLKNFRNTYAVSPDNSIDKAKVDTQKDEDLSPKEKAEIYRNLEFARTSFEKAVEANAFGFTAAPTGGAAPAPTPPPAGGTNP
jgi:hypothetical protein